MFERTIPEVGNVFGEGSLVERVVRCPGVSRAVFCTWSRVIIAEMLRRHRNRAARNSPMQKRTKQKSKHAVIR
jgi:hypothetical protein